MLFSWRAANDALLATALLAVSKCGKPVGVAGAASPPELLTAVRRRVEVERDLVLVARTDVGTQLTQVCHRQPPIIPALNNVNVDVRSRFIQRAIAKPLTRRVRYSIEKTFQITTKTAKGT